MKVFAYISALIIGLLFSGVVSAGSLPDRVCKPQVSGSATAFLKVSAKRDTVNDWKARVRELYGDDWADYHNAKIVLFPCNRAGLITQACEVRAQPCMEVSS